MSDRLTLHAEGPATVETRREVAGMDVSEEMTVSLDVSTQLDEDDLAELINVSTQGATLSRRRVIKFVTERLNETGAAPDETYRIDRERRDAWTVRLTGRVDTWTDVAVELAVDRVASKSKRATLACDILDSLAGEIDDPGQRPVLAMLDLLAEYDVSGYSRESLLDRLGGDEGQVDGVAVDQEADA